MAGVGKETHQKHHVFANWFLSSDLRPAILNSLCVTGESHSPSVSLPNNKLEKIINHTDNRKAKLSTVSQENERDYRGSFFALSQEK